MKPKQNKEEKSGASYDKCQTPVHALDPLIPHLKHRDAIRYFTNIPRLRIWEPACGEGILAEGMQPYGEVLATDIEKGHDFLLDPFLEADVQITNPPYSMKYQWLFRSYCLNIPFALLLPLETLGAWKGQQLFTKYGMQLIILDRRINFKMPEKGWDGKGAQFPTAWFTWKFSLPRDIMYYSFREGRYL